MLSKIKSSLEAHKFFWIFLFFYLIFRFFIINTNSAEWGDSYRILRATEFLQSFTYPDDEKRPPLFSVLLLLKLHDDPVVSGRIVMIFVSLLNLTLLYSLSQKIVFNIQTKSEYYRYIPLISTVLFSITPLFLYWSLRIYADNLFLVLLLSSFNIFLLLMKSVKEIHKVLYSLLLSLITILSILTRFEGYLIFASVSFSLFVYFILKKVGNLKPFLIYTLFTLGLIFLASYYDKFTFYENPFVSSYVAEVESRKLTVKEVSNYIFQLIFLSGSIVGFLFLVLGLRSFLNKNLAINIFLPIYFYILMQLALSFIWFAAVPRLFLPILPFYILITVIGVLIFCENILEVINKTFLKKFILIFFVLLLTYVGSQYFLKVPFLITGFRMLAVNIFMGILGIFLLSILIFRLKNVSKIFIARSIFLYLFASFLTWSYLFISLEKDTYKVLNQAVTYFINNYPKDSIVLSNDVSSITRFYLSDRFVYSSEIDSGKGLSGKIDRSNPDFIIVTNEHNPSMSFTPSKIPGLILEKEFKEVVNSRLFFTQIIRVNTLELN